MDLNGFKCLFVIFWINFSQLLSENQILKLEKFLQKVSCMQNAIANKIIIALKKLLQAWKLFVFFATPTYKKTFWKQAKNILLSGASHIVHKKASICLFEDEIYWQWVQWLENCW